LEQTQILAKAPDAQYPILIARGLLQSLPTLLAEHNLTGRVAVVTNQTIAPLYGETLVATLGTRASLIQVPDGEQYKTLDTIRTLYDGFVDAGLDRRGVVIGLGGGVIGDMAGFAAATYLRGVAFVQIPTSLLAMVDSSVGGKVGVDLPQGKNLIGAFKQPEMVLVDTAVLDTLPDVEWRCGLAEVIKAGFLRDTSLLDLSLYQRGDNASTQRFIERAIAFKVDIVQEDPYEANIRAWLNLGHTFGHALERVSNYQIRHGEAVSIGLVAAGRLSHLHGLCDETVPGKIEKILTALKMPVRYRDYQPADIRAAMGTDKKRQSDRIRFVLLQAVGDPVLCDDVPDSKVLSVLESLRE
jgi:3-dehydroquinate synthase